MRNGTITKTLVAISIITVIVLVFFTVSQTAKSKSVPKVQSQDKKIKILIVAGHEPNAGGADEFKSIKERDLNLRLAESLRDNLSRNTNLDIIMARDENGWNKDLKNYVMTSSTTIMSWVKDMKDKMMARVNTGEIKLINPDMKHNDATTSAVLFLYATNKWADENDVDLVINIHFNSNPKINGKPNYSGYCIYIPDNQYNNASSSRIFANYLNEEIAKIENPSTMPEEKKTIIEDQALIAIGNYDTLKIPTAVTEYAYMYETKMLSTSTRNSFIEKAASSTATAIKNYINSEMKK